MAATPAIGSGIRVKSKMMMSECFVPKRRFSCKPPTHAYIIAGERMNHRHRHCYYLPFCIWKLCKLCDFIALNLFSAYIYLCTRQPISLLQLHLQSYLQHALDRAHSPFRIDFNFARVSLIIFARIRQYLLPSPAVKLFKFASFASHAYIPFHSLSHAYSIWNSIISISLW